MSISTTDTCDNAGMQALWEPVAQVVVDQLSDLVGARLVTGPTAVVQGEWQELMAQMPVEVTMAQVTLEGGCQGVCGLFWAVADTGAPDEWLNNDEVRSGLWEAVTAGVTSGLHAGTGQFVSLSVQREPVVGTPIQPVGIDGEIPRALLYWEAVGDGVSFFFGVMPAVTVSIEPDQKQPAAERFTAVGPTSGMVQARSPKLPSIQSNGGERMRDLDIIMDLPLRLTVEIGSTQMPIKDVLSLGKGSVVELNRLAGEPIDVMVNGKLLAHGEIVVLPDGNFGVRVTEIINASDRLRNLQAK